MNSNWGETSFHHITRITGRMMTKTTVVEVVSEAAKFKSSDKVTRT